MAHQKIGRNSDSESVRGSLNLQEWEWERLQIQVKIACRDIDCTTSWKHVPDRQKHEVFSSLLRLDWLAGREDVADWLMHYHWRKRNIVFQAQRRRYSRRRLLLEEEEEESGGGGGMLSSTGKKNVRRDSTVDENRPDRRGRLDFILNAEDPEDLE